MATLSRLGACPIVACSKADWKLESGLVTEVDEKRIGLVSVLISFHHRLSFHHRHCANARQHIHRALLAVASR